MAKRKKTELVTPFGRAAWCALARPSTTFKADGEYSARILLEPGPETDAFIAQLDQLYEDAYRENLATVQKDRPKIESIKRADKPYKHQEDPDTGETMPGFQLNARLGAVVRGKSPGNDADGNSIPGPKLYTRQPQVKDAKNQAIVPTPEIGGGSIIRLAIDAEPFFTASIGSGVSLRLMGVQIQKLIPLGVRDTQFGEVDGYEANAVTASDPVETMHAPATDVPNNDSAEGDVPTAW